MKKTDCCLLHDFWSDPISVQWITVMFRVLAAMIALAAVATSWFERHRFLEGHSSTVATVWASASVCWLISCIPLVVCLIHCAATTTFKHDASLNIPSEELVLRFRKVYSLWTLHDIVLGIFWLYLSVMIYDLADDEDDSEWRTIFLSMLSWHIVVVVLHYMYFKPFSDVNKESKRSDGPCCVPRNAEYVWSFFTICAYIGMYTVVIRRMQRPNLLDLGTDSMMDPIVFSISLSVFAMGKWDRDTVTTRQSSVPLLVVNKRKLDF